MIVVSNRSKEKHMMIATNFGIYEVGLRPADTIAEGDDQVLQVRSRRRIDLTMLRAYLQEAMGPTIELDVPGGVDWQYRAYISRAGLADLMSNVIDDIGYVEFKKDAVDDGLYAALNDMWTVVLRRFPVGSRYQGSIKRLKW
jgi:hypothetical protein